MRRLALLVVVGTAAAFLWRRRSRRLPRVGSPGQRVLVVGADPVLVASLVTPGGTVELVSDARRDLDRWLTRTAAAGLDGVVATQAAAASLPFADGSMDAAYVGVRGEAALREARRVVRAGGRVVSRD